MQKPSEHPLAICFQLAQRLGDQGASIWKVGKTITDPTEKLAYLHKALSFVREKAKESEKWERIPVDFRTFIESEDFLNRPNALWPEVMAAGEAINSGRYVECVLTGGIGVGKSFLAICTQAYQLYILTCMREPHQAFDLDPSSAITIVFQSLNKELAKDVDYSTFRAMIDDSPYFRFHEPYDKDRASDMRFLRKRIIVKPVSGEDTAAIGQNVIGGILDECFVAGTRVATPFGERVIETLQAGDTVLSPGTDGIAEDIVVAAEKIGKRAVFQLDFASGETLICTPNHPFLTDRGWVQACSLTAEDTVYARAEIPRKIPAMAGEAARTAQAAVSTETAAKGSSPFPGGENTGRRKAAATYAGHGTGYEFDPGNVTKTVGEQPRSAIAQSNGHPGSTSGSAGLSARQGALRSYQGQDVTFGGSEAAASGVFGQSASCVHEVFGASEIPALEIGNSVCRAHGRGRFGSRLSLRNRLGALRSTQYAGGLSGGNIGGYGAGGGEGTLRYRTEPGQAHGSREIRGVPRLGLAGLVGDRLVSRAFVGLRDVYNLTVRDARAYFANGMAVHNCNFMAVVAKSKVSKDGGTYDQAISNYNSIARRRESRFMQLGNLPGMLCLVSSRNYPGQFTDKKEAEAKTNPRIYIYDKRSWEVRPWLFGTARFKVFVGDATRKPRVLREDEDVSRADQNLVMEIPVEYRHQFEADLLSALRDIAGVATQALHPFMMNIEAVAACFGHHPSIFSRPDCDFVNSQVEILKEHIVNRDQPRYAHVDLAISRDSAGISIAHVPKFVTIRRGETVEIMPVIQIDGILEVPPPKGGEIEFENIHQLLYSLRDKYGIPLKWVSFDSFQSKSSLQVLYRNGFITGHLSMDVNTFAYDVMKSAFYDDRIRAPEHAKALHELTTLEFDPKANKIDHTPFGSKDISDSIAGVVCGLTMRREIWVRHRVPTWRAPQSLRQPQGGKDSLRDLA